MNIIKLQSDQPKPGVARVRCGVLKQTFTAERLVTQIHKHIPTLLKGPLSEEGGGDVWQTLNPGLYLFSVSEI